MTPPVIPVRFWNLPLWMARTFGQDYFHKEKLDRAARPLTWARIRASVFPKIERPIFIIGAARSGTTFLGDSLGAVPEISYHHEPVATKGASRHVFLGHWSEQKAAQFYRWVYRWLLRVNLNGDLRFAEKTPRNALHVGFLYRTFPDAQFLHIVRDGRAAALSLTKKPWLSEIRRDKKVVYEPGGNPMGPYPRYWTEPGRETEFNATSDIHRAIWGWRALTQGGIEGLKEVPERQVLRLRYEDLVVQPGENADQVLDFLGIDAAESRAILHREFRKGHTASVDAWKEQLTSEDLEVIDREAGELMRQLGYGSSEDPKPGRDGEIELRRAG